MKLLSSVLLICVVCLTGCRTPFGKNRQPSEPFGDLNLVDASLPQVLMKYSEISEKRVDSAGDLFAREITLQTNGVSVSRQLMLLEKKLADENIGMFTISSNRVVAAWLVPDVNPARLYLKRCKVMGSVVPLGKLGWDVVHDYWRTVPELHELRIQFEKADSAVMDLLRQDPELRTAGEKFETTEGPEREKMARNLAGIQDRVVARLLEESETFREAGRRREKSLFSCNIQTMEYIINDYEKRGVPLPGDWM